MMYAGWRLIIVVLLVLTPTLAHSATYYVTPLGGPNNNCAAATNSTTPIAGLNNAAACLAAGDTLILKDGTYNEALGDVIPSGLSASQPTTLRAEHQRQAVLTTLEAGAPCHIRLGIRDVAPRPFVTIDGLVFDIPTNAGAGPVCNYNGPGTSPPNYAIDYTHDLQFLNNEVRGGMNTGSLDSPSAGIGIGGGEHHITIRGNYIHDIGMVGTLGGPAWSYGMYISGHDMVIENNEITRTSGYGFHGYSVHDDVAYPGIPHFENNIIRNNYFHDTGGPLLFACPGKNNQIYNNIVARTGIGPAFQRGGIVLGTDCSGSPADSNQVYNNTIVWTVGAGACGRGIMLSCSGAVSASNNIVRNNILWQNNPDDSISDTSSGAGTNTIDHNLCTGTGCSTAGNPLFAKTIPNSDLAAAGIRPEDFQLQNGSPALGIGADVSSVVATDYAGTSRPQPVGSSPDLGAWEMGGSAINVLPQELYLYWPLNESSGTTAADATANNHPGTLVGTPLPVHTGGRVGAQGLRVGGTGDHVETTTLSLPAGQPVTLMFWTFTASGVPQALGAPTATPTLFGVCAPCPDNYLYWQYGTWNDPGGGGSLFLDFTPYVGTWAHVAVGADGGTQGKIWVNGQLKVTSTNFSAPSGSVAGFEAGRWNKPGRVVNGQGTLDDVRLYTQFLSDADVQSLYRATAGRVRHIVQGN
jgi:hypothetical protein